MICKNLGSKGPLGSLLSIALFFTIACHNEGFQGNNTPGESHTPSHEGEIENIKQALADQVGGDHMLDEGGSLLILVALQSEDIVGYSWQKATASTGPYVDLEDQTSPSLNLVSVTPSDTGYYRIKVQVHYSIPWAEDMIVDLYSPSFSIVVNEISPDPTPDPGPDPEAFQITLDLIDATTDATLSSELADNSLVDLSNGMAFSFHCKANQELRNVKFYFSSGYSNTEGQKPFAACGDNSGDFNDCRGQLSGSSVSMTVEATSSMGETASMSIQLKLEKADDPTPTPNTKPVITLSGNLDLVLLQGNIYVEPGYLATDAEDGDLTSSVVVSGSVDTSVLGTTTLTYDVSDSSGLAADSKTRTVTVVEDTTSDPSPDPDPGSGNVLDTLAVNQWYEIPNSNMSAVDPCPRRDCSYSAILGQSAVIQAWGGGTMDTKRGLYLIWGGGHNDYAGNELYAYDLNSLSWSRLTEPSDPPPKDTDPGPDGKPVSRHTYGGLAYLPNVDGFFGHGGARYQSGYATNVPWVFDLTGNKWIKGTSAGSGSHSSVAAYDVNTGTVLLKDQYELYRYNPVNDTWTLLHNYAQTAYHQYGAFDHTRNQFVIIGSNKTSRMYQIDGNSATHSTISPSGATEALSGSYPGVVYVESTDRYYIWSGGSTIYEMTPETWVIRKLPVAAGSDTPTAATQAGTYGRFAYLPSKNIFVIVNSTSENIFAYKLGPSDASGGGDDSSTPTVNQRPTLSLIGESVAQVELGTSYTDPGATASDPEDGDISSQIQVSGTVDVNTAGSYTLYYNVTDSKGAKADTISRTVAVLNSTNPDDSPSLEGGHPAPEGQPETLGIHQDGATTQTIALAVDDQGYSAVELYYRRLNHSTYYRGHDLYRHSNDIGTLMAQNQYAGMMFNLSPGVEYEIVLVAIKDGVRMLDTVQYSTRSIPPHIAEESANTLRVSSETELQEALNNAKSGDLILLAAGNYSGTFSIGNSSGTFANPIVVRGAANFATIIDGQGGSRCFTINNSNYVHLEDIHLTNCSTGVEVRDWSSDGDGTRGNVIRRNKITEVVVGINSKSNGGSGPGNDALYVVDNQLTGTNVYGDTSNATWNDEGIVVVGNSIEVAYNTLSGFGDSLGLSRSDRNRAIEIHNNLVLFGGDDGVELDFTDRNTVAHTNLLTNTGDGISFQMSYNGPAFAFKNVIYNVLPERGPYKIKPEAECNDGVFLYNNTSLNAGRAWINFSACATDVTFKNNLFTGDTTERDVLRLDSSTFNNLKWDYNAYIYDGYFQMRSFYYTTFEGWSNQGPYGDNDLLLAGEVVFATVSIFSPQTGLGSYKEAKGLDFSLDASSSGVDGGVVIHGVTDHHIGSAPDVGAYELGKPAPHYGVR